MFMNTIQEIPHNELSSFKGQVKEWLDNDQQISHLENQIKLLKKQNKELEPTITGFMRQYNITDLNTSIGKIKCNQRNTKKPLNKLNIRNNLSLIISDAQIVEQAMDKILTNRPIVTTYKLVKPKVSLSLQ